MGWRWPAFAVVVACFFVQAALVWRDVGPHPGSSLAMSSLARDGQALFRRQGCQSCHALYGMGGFLGPDLTNAARRVPPARFAQLLHDGAGPMPAYRLDASAQAAIGAYLQAVDATGQGTPPAPAGDGGPLFAAALQRGRTTAGPLPADVVAGARLVGEGSCGGCHRSFAVDPSLRAPDLSLARTHLSTDELRQVLVHGRGLMPPSGLDGRQTAQVLAFLDWLSAHRDALAPRRALDFGALPWFAYGLAPASDAAAETKR